MKYDNFRARWLAKKLAGKSEGKGLEWMRKDGGYVVKDGSREMFVNCSECKSKECVHGVCPYLV